MNLEELIKEARIIYPIGTSYESIHCKGANIKAYIHSHNFRMIGSCLGIGSGNLHINNHQYSETVYNSYGEWATIISYPKEREVNFEIY